jgi:CBS domain-containing protein
MTIDPITIGPEAGVLDAASVMAENGIGGLPVVDADGKLLGVIEDDDVIVEDARLPEPTYIQFLGAYIEVPGTLRHFEKEFKRAVAATVADAMHTDVATVEPDATAEDVATLLHERKLNRVPVVDSDGKLVGIVARGDIVRMISRQTS